MVCLILVGLQNLPISRIFPLWNLKSVQVDNIFALVYFPLVGALGNLREPLAPEPESSEVGSETQISQPEQEILHRADEKICSEDEKSDPLQDASTDTSHADGQLSGKAETHA